MRERRDREREKEIHYKEIVWTLRSPTTAVSKLKIQGSLWDSSSPSPKV